MAQSAVEFIQGGLLDAKKRAERYKGPAIKPNSDLYQKWKQDVGLHPDLPGTLTGALANSISVIRNSAGGHVVGIREKTKTRRPVVGRVPISYAKKEVYVGDYAIAQELGPADGSRPARPLVTGLMVGFLETINTKWAKAFEEMMQEAYWAGMDDKSLVEGAKVFNSSDIMTSEEAGSGATTAGVLHTNSIKRALESSGAVISSVSSNITDIENFLEKVASQPESMRMNPTAQAAVINVLAEMLGKGTTYDNSEIKRIIDATLEGKMVNIPETRSR